MVFANAGSYTIRVTPSNSVGNSPCTKRICVVESDTRASFRRGDGNADGEVNITDGIFVLNFLFLGGPEPPAPGPTDCGPDETEDDNAECAPASCP
jgi:hypothetical protein